MSLTCLTRDREVLRFEGHRKKRMKDLLDEPADKVSNIIQEFSYPGRMRGSGQVELLKRSTKMLGRRLYLAWGGGVVLLGTAFLQERPI